MTHPIDNSTLASPVERPRRPSRVLIPLLLALTTISVYWPILNHRFVALDDGSTVYENRKLRDLTLSNFCSFWTSPQAELYAPLTYSLFAGITFVARRHSPGGPADQGLFNPMPFHAVSLLLHVMAVLVVYQLLVRLIGRRWPAAAGALVFSLHPIQVETVAWVTEINGLLCSFFSLLAVFLFHRGIAGPTETGAPGDVPLEPSHDGRKWLLPATYAFVLALLAKPLGVVTPLLAAVIFWMARRRDDAAHRRRPGAAVLTLALWLVLASGMAVVACLSQPVDGDFHVPYRLRPLVAGDALFFYIYKLLIPVNLTPDYARSPDYINHIGWAQITWIVPALVACGVLWLWWRRGANSVVAGAIWFVAALLPVLGLTTFAFQRLSTVADRYLYLPMFGVALCVGATLNRIAPWESGGASGRRSSLKNRILVVGTLILLAALAVRTEFQLPYWYNSDALFEHSRQIIGRDPGHHLPQPQSQKFPTPSPGGR